MKLILMSLFLSLTGFLFGQSANTKSDSATKLLAKAVKAHGGKKYNKAHFQFTFRENIYRFKNSKKGYSYSVTKSKDGKQVFDQLINGVFSRSINGESVSLNEKEKRGGSNGLNSVIYFATLPHKLLDPAVSVELGGASKINGVDYQILRVNFAKEGGGDDHDDNYVYWIRKDNFQIDYFAYDYKVNGGGVRFRTAYNKRIVDGILFQDYVNYKAEVGTPLIDLPALFEKDGLKKLSIIATEKVSIIK